MLQDKNILSKCLYFFILLLPVLILINCNAIRKYTDILKPKLTVQKVRVTNMTFEAVDLTFDVRIENPNRLSVTLAGFDYDLMINNTSFLKGEQNNQLSITALGESTIEIPLNLKFKKIYQAYRSLKSQDSSSYKIKIGLNFDLPILGRTYIPVSTGGYLPLLRVPSIKISTLRLKKMGLTGADLELEMTVDNPNGINLVLNGFSYDLEINGRNWVNGISNDQVLIKPKNTGIIRIPISLNFLQMGNTISRIIMGNEALSYTFQGNLDVGSSNALLNRVNLPVFKSGELNIIK